MDFKDLVGREVIIQNPSFDNDSIWRGNAIAFIDVPSLVIDNSIDPRMTLTAEWAVDSDKVIIHRKYLGFANKLCYCSIGSDHNYDSKHPFRERD